MIENNSLRIHVINVGHGDSILVEFPDDVSGARLPRFGLVDAGGEDAQVRDKTCRYIRSFLEYRLELPADSNFAAGAFRFEFVCLTHPHADHLYGMMPVLEHFCAAAMPQDLWPRQFWDCGFRYNSMGYLELLQFLVNHSDVQFMRVSSGTEFHYDETEILVLAPSVDMRNRYDTYGVDVNDASIILRLSLGNGVVILTGDAHFDSWGKVCEEFPRKRHLVYPFDSQGRPDMRDPNRGDIAFLNKEDQLNCQLLKVAHHGSKRGTSYEYIEKLSPRYFAIPCDLNDEYQASWRNKFPHPITRLILGEEAGIYNESSSNIPTVNTLAQRVRTTAGNGTLVYRVTRGGQTQLVTLGDTKHQPVTAALLTSRL